MGVDRAMAGLEDADIASEKKTNKKSPTETKKVVSGGLHSL